MLTVTYAVVSERFHKRGVFIVISVCTAIIGYIILITNKNPAKRPGVSYVGVFFAAAGIYPAVALTLSWPAMNVGGQTKRATACALQITIGNLGAVIGTQLYRSTDGPRYLVGHSVALGYLCANVLVVLTTLLVLSRANKKRAAISTSAMSSDELWKGDDDARWRFTL